MFGLGTWEMVIILVAALIFIGPGKLPDLARTLGKGMRELKRAMAGFENEARQAVSVPTHESEDGADKGDPRDLVVDEAGEPADGTSERELPEVHAPSAPRVAAGRPQESVDDDETARETGAGAKAETGADADAGAETGADAVAGAGAKTEAGAETEAGAKTEAVTGADAETGAGAAHATSIEATSPTKTT